MKTFAVVLLLMILGVFGMLYYATRDPFAIALGISTILIIVLTDIIDERKKRKGKLR